MSVLRDISQDQVLTLAEYLAPEALLLILERAGVDVPGTLTEMFNACAPGPNVVHRVAARVLRMGGSVWTTNYDTLIEEALEELRRSVAPEEQVAPVKVHGTFDPRPSGRWDRPSGPLLFSSPALLRGLDPKHLFLMRREFDDRDVHVFGYAGADIDLFPALRETLPTARSLRWYLPSSGDLDGSLRDLRDRYGLTPEDGRRRIEVDQDPAGRLLRNLSESMGGLLDDLLTTPRRPQWSDLPNTPIRLSFANRVEMAYQLSVERHLVPSALPKQGAWVQWRLALRGRAPQWRAGKLRARLLRLMTLKAVWRPLRREFRRIAAHDLRHDEPWPPTNVLMEWASHDWQPAVALAISRRLSLEGHLRASIDHAQASLIEALRVPDSPGIVGSFAFQLSDSQRTAGLLDEAVAGALRGFSAVSSVVMALWQEFTRLASSAMTGKPLSPVELDRVERLEGAFATAGQPAGTIWISLVRVMDHKNRGLFEMAADGAARCEEESEARGLRLLATIARFQRADSMRLWAAQDPARGTSRVSEALADLGEHPPLLLLRDVMDLLTDPETREAELRELLTRAERMSFSFAVSLLERIQALDPARRRHVSINWI